MLTGQGSVIKYFTGRLRKSVHGRPLFNLYKQAPGPDNS